MTTFPGTPRHLKGGLVLVDPENFAVQRVITFQFNPETVTRTIESMGIGEDSGDRLETLRLKGPPAETIKVEAVIDAADQLEFPEQSQDIVEDGILPQLDVLETILYPASRTLQQHDSLANAGTLEITPAEAPLPLFVWSAKRILPVRLIEFSITEEFFDVSLNPIRAKISLGMRVLNSNDFRFSSRGNSLFVVHHQQKEQRANRNTRSVLVKLGINSIP